MEILGVGPLEILFIFLIALIVLGPQDMKKAGLTLGRFMRKVVTSQGWRDFQQGWRNLRYLPNKMMREAGLEEDVKSINESMKELQKIKPSFDTKELNKDLQEATRDISAWTTPPLIPLQSNQNQETVPEKTSDTSNTANSLADKQPEEAITQEDISTSTSDSESKNA